MRFVLALACALAASHAAATTKVITGSGAAPADINGAVAEFRARLGSNLGDAVGSGAVGRREVNWDVGGGGVPEGSIVFGSTLDAFAFRGVTVSTPKGALEISGETFGNLNDYTDIFTPFSSPRLFAPLGATITDVRFNRPGAIDEAATTRAFGAVFLDVDMASTSGLEFFDIHGFSLGKAYAPVAGRGLSFVGVDFGFNVVGSVRVFNGNTPVGADDGGDVDIVVLDDFIFGEPGGRLAGAAPEPATWGMMLLGFGCAGQILRRRPRAGLPA
jgi:hypothetical protein